MAVLVNPDTVDLLRQEAAQSVAANPPSRVLLIAIAAVFTALGFVIGRVYLGAHFCALAVRYGYRQGAKIQVEPKRPATT